MPAITVAMRTEISNLYVSLFGRAPDGEGLGFWVSSYSNGNTLAKIAQSMYDTAPARAYYPLFATPSEVVTTFYTNVLGRAPDAEGLAFWVKEYNASSTQGAFFEKLISNVVNYNGTDAAGVASKSLFANKVAVAQYYGEQNGTVAGATAALNGVTSAAASVDAAKAVILNTAVSGQTFTLTTSVDNFSGGSGADAFSGVIANVAAANTTGTTFQAGDILSGGAGTDTLNISVAGGNAGTNAAVTLTGIEKVLVSNVNSATQSISLALADSALTTVGHASSNTNAVTTFAGLNKIVASELSNGDAGITLSYNSTVIAGTADSASLTLSNQTGGTFTSTGIETLNVASNTSANTVTLAAGPTTVNVSGAAKLTLGALDTGITTLNASTNTGGVVATLSSTATAVITGSSAADTITAGTNMSGVGAVNAGDGVDILVSTADALIAAAADGARFTNFETLSISSTSLGASATRTQNMSQIAGITTLNVTSARADGTAGDTTHGVTLSNLAATTNTLNITGLASADATATDDFDVTVTATRAVNTTADAMTVNLGTSTATVGTTATATGTAAAGGNTLALSLANEESITINSLGGTSGTNFVAGITNGAATSVTATGARALSFASMSSQVVTKIDASAMTGAFIMGTNAGAVASTISGGTGADTLTGGSAADNISGGAGNDSITGAAGADVITGGDGLDTILGGAGIDNLSGGAGNDTFLVTTAADFTNLTSAEVVSGGDGTLDNLSFSETATAITVSAADLTGISGIERITINGTTAAGSITLTDAVYTANGSTTLSIVDGLLDGNTTGTLTVNASALTAANSISVTANTVTGNNDTLTGGAGNDTFLFSTVAGLEATDTVVGGAGTDTISLSAAAAVTAVMNGVTLVESIVTTGSAADASVTLGADTVIAAAGTLTTDASSMTAGGSIELTYDGSGITTTTKIQNVTGSAGDDVIAGGSGNDIIVGADGNDSITGGAGIDNLSGGAGNDIFVIATTGTGFTGLTTAETVSGGAGSDTLQVAAGAITIAAADLVNVSGVETIVISNTTETASLTLTDAWFTANGTTSLTVNSVTATSGALTLAASTLSAANSLVVNAGGTTSAAHVINLGAGNDSLTIDLSALNNTTTLAGGAGTDTLIFSANTGSGSITQDATVTGFETVSFLAAGVAGTFATVVNNAGVAAGATQTINASNVTGTLLWNGAAELDGKFSITGGTGADSLTGGSLVDTITAGLGADVITGGLGADSLTGGLGADTFVYALVTQSNATNTDTITDFVTGTDKLQITLDYSALTVALDINAVRSSAGVAGSTLAQDTLSGQRGQYVYDTTNSALFVNVNNDNLLTTSDYKININAASTATASIVDGDVNFVITGGTNVDTIITAGGADTISSGGGADIITSGAGVDSITATAGGTLDSGAGADTITMNGAGDYIVKFVSATGADTVVNTTGWASAGNDKFQVSMGGFVVGDGNTTVANGSTVTGLAGGGEVAVNAELSVITTNVLAGVGGAATDLTFATAVAVAGAAGALFAGNVAAGVTKILAFDDGADTAIFLFTSAAADATIVAGELTLIGFVSGLAATAFGDYAFIA
jgi:Ca2+-binding RTX toxin-like protein